MSDLFANCRVIIEGLAYPNPNFLKIESGIKFMLAPKSHNALLKKELSMVQRIVKLPGSFNFFGNFLYRMALHSSVRFTVSNSPRCLFLDKVSFMNFT